VAWKNTKQPSLADSMLIHDAIKGLDEIYSLIDWSNISLYEACI
jgi:hypothetical protein